MRLTGYGDLNWEPLGFTCGLPDNLVPYPTVDPTILPRPGGFATFGVNVVREMTIPCEMFFLTGTGTLGSISYEEAFAYLFKRLNAVDGRPRQLRRISNAGVAGWIPAVVQIPQRGSDQVNVKLVTFLAVQPDWLDLTVSTGSRTFS
jgi:hypothetical protein